MQSDCFETLLTSVSDRPVHWLRKNWSDELDYWLDFVLVVTCGVYVGGVQTWDYVRSDVVRGWAHYCGGMTVYTFVYMEVGGSVCLSVWEVSWYHWYYHIRVCSWLSVVHRLNVSHCFYILYVFSESWFEMSTSLSHIRFLAGITCDFVYSTFFIIWYMDLCCGSYELVQYSNLERYAYIGVFKETGNFSYLRAIVNKDGPHLLVFLLGLCVTTSICRLNFWNSCCRKLLFLAIFCIVFHSFCFLPGSSGRECIIDMWNLNAAIFCSMEWLERKLIVTSVVAGFLYVSTLSFIRLRSIVRSRKSMELCLSYVGLSFILLFILLIYVLMVFKLIFVVSNMTKMSSTYRT